MELVNEFSVAAPVERAWALLLDVEKVAPCMPGAALTSFDGESFTGSVKVKIGPVSLTYQGKGRIVSRDESSRTVVLEASGKDSRGTGTAAATVTGTLSPTDSGTLVRVVTDLHITGSQASAARGMLNSVAERITGQFASCLAESLSNVQTRETEPVDLLEATGASRVLPYVLMGLGVVVIIALVWALFF